MDASDTEIVSFYNPESMDYYMGETRVGMCDDEITISRTDDVSSIIIADNRYMFNDGIDHICVEFTQSNGPDGDTIYFVDEDGNERYYDL